MGELRESSTGWEGVQGALDEIHACTAEFDRFFSGVVLELDGLSEELEIRGRQVSALRDERPRYDSTASEQRQTELTEALRQIQDQVAQLAETATDLAAVQAVAGPPVADQDEIRARAAQAESEFCQLAEQHAALERERDALEAELDLVRTRAAELDVALAEQKRSELAQRAGWTEDLSYLRRAFEQLTGRVAELGRSAAGSVPVAAPAETPPAASPPAVKKPAQGDDPVLGSVVAQFARLQRDKLRRRSGSS